MILKKLNILKNLPFENGEVTGHYL